MGAKRAKDNVNWKIGLLEAKKGQVPMVGAAHAAVRRQERRRISRAKKTARAQGHRRTDTESVISEGLVPSQNKEDIEKELHRLLCEKSARKVYALKKELRRSVKKACTLESQKISKRLQVLADQEESRERLTLEGKLDSLKSLDLEKETDRIFYDAVAKDPSLTSHPLLPPREADTKEEGKEDVDTSEKSNDKILPGKSSKKPFVLPMTESLRAAVSLTLKGLIEALDLLSNPKKRKEVQAERRRRQQRQSSGSPLEGSDHSLTDANAPIPTTASSLFLSSLGGDEVSDAEEEEEEEEGLPHQGRSSKRQKRHSEEIEDDEDFFLDAFEEEELTVKGKHLEGAFEDAHFDQYYGGVKGKKNRSGQRARQKKAEQKFGRDAHHVKQRETVKAAKATTRRGPSSRKSSSSSSSTTSSANPSNLHPSWKAKREQGSTARFEGKKTTFSSEDPTNALGPSDHHEKPFKHVGPPKRPTSEDLASMHPSWEAKRRQKMALSISTTAPASGNKIKFDVDEE